MLNEIEYIKQNFAGINIIKEIKGGSSARLFVIRDKNMKCHVIKICARDGIENGKQKLIGELIFLRELFDLGIDYFASVERYFYDSSIAWYIMPYYSEYVLLKDILYNENCKEDLLKIIFDKIFADFYMHEQSRAPDDFLIKRNIQRVKKRLETAARMNFGYPYYTKEFVMNGTKLLSVKKIFERITSDKEMMKILSPEFVCRTHDDLTIENILVQKMNFIVLDPRGNSDTNNYRDYIYDLTKFSCTLGGFTNLKYGEFSLYERGKDDYVLDINLNKFSYYYQYIINDFKERIKKMEDHCDAMLRFFFTEACHYLADVPCRLDNQDNSQVVFAIYLKGLYDLNKFIESFNCYKN